MKKRNTGKIFNVSLALVMLAGLVATMTNCATELAVTVTQTADGPTVTVTPTPTPEPEPTIALHDPLVRFKIATTTSLYDTGLWYYLEPIFEEYANVEMDIIYAGTGIALEYGRRGDVDVVVVHDRAAEDKFISEGYGIDRRNFGYNFFLIAGPESDPAGIKGSTAAEAFKKIHDMGMSGRSEEHTSELQS